MNDRGPIASGAPPRERGAKRLLNALYRVVFGFDYFISYTWNDVANPDKDWPIAWGRQYAVKLREALRQEKFVCFLDSEDYAAGQNWRWFGQLALRGTARLIVVLSPAATRSQPMLDEVEYFKTTGRLVVPVEFAGCEFEDKAAPLLSLIERETIRVHEPVSAPAGGPTRESIDKLVKTFTLTRQVSVRRRALGLTIIAFAVAILAILYIGYLAKIESANRRLAVTGESIARGARAEALAKIPAENMYALQVAVSAVAPPLQEGLEIPIQALRGLATALDSVRRSLPLTLPEDAATAPQERSKYSTMRWQMAGETPLSAGFSEHGDRVRVATQAGFGEWDRRSGKRLSWSAVPLIAAADDMSSLIVVEDDAAIFRKSGDPGRRLRLADATTLSIASISPRGDRLLLENTKSGTEQPAVDIYDSSNGKVVSTLKGHTGRVMRAGFSPDGTKVITAGADKTIRVWDTEQGVQRSLIEQSEGALFVNFSPDGTEIVSGGPGNTGHIWHADTGAELARLEGHAGRVTWGSFSRDGKQIVTTSDDHTARVWNAEGKSVQTLDGHRGQVSMATFGPRGSIVTVSTDERLVRVWSLSPDGSAASFRDHKGAIRDLAFSTSGDWLLSAGEDGTVRIWPLHESFSKQMLGEPSEQPIEMARFSPNAALVLARGKDGMARLWRTTSGQPIGVLRENDEQVIDAGFSPDGSRIFALSADGSLRLWDSESAKLINKAAINIAEPTSACLAGDGSHILVAGGSGRIALIDASTMAVVYRREGEWAGKISCSRRVFAALGYSSASFFRLNGDLIKNVEIPSRMVWTANFSPDGKFFVTTDNNRVVALWEPLTAELNGFLQGNPGVVKQLAFSADGTRLAVGDNSDVETATVWDLNRRQRIFDLEGQRDVTCLAFSQDGGRIATGGGDGVIKIWEVGAETLLRQARSYLDVYNQHKPSWFRDE